MKKFLFTIFILMVLGGAGFFFGWAQLNVPPGSYGIIYSKTHGIDPKPVQAGEFRWIWYKLIPTNVRISVFQLKTYKFPIDFDSTLPSGASYASFAGLSSVDFSWNLSGEVNFGISPDTLVSLVSRYNLIDQQALDEYCQEIAQNIKMMIIQTFSSVDIDNLRLEKILSGNRDLQLETDIKNRYPEIVDFSLIINSAKFPDFTLYRQVWLLYEDFLTKQRDFISAAFGRRAENHLEIQLRFIELEGYGELLTKYPVLLEYLALNRGNEEQ
jgi:hypothetical protein